MKFLIVLLIVWSVVFIYMFFRGFFEDGKWGQYKIGVALFVAFAFSTIMPLDFIFGLIMSPKKTIKRLISSKQK